MPAGRPKSEVPKDKADSVLEWIKSGRTLREWSRQPGNCSHDAVEDWQVKDEEFKRLFACAREIGEHAISEESLEIVDELPTYIDEKGIKRLDPAGVQRNRIRAEHRLKLLAKWNPRKWGEKTDLNLSGSVDLGLAEAIRKGRERLEE